MQNLYQRPHSPFDDTAIERLRRMGLADADGRAGGPRCNDRLCQHFRRPVLRRSLRLLPGLNGCPGAADADV